MATQKHFLQDRTALLLVSGTAFLTLAAMVLIILQLSNGHTASNLIVQCRDCSEKFDATRFVSGTIRDIVGFIVAAVLFFGLSVTLAYKAYPVKRELSLVILGLTFPLLVFLMVVSNALLSLR